ncbi:MAG: formate-dependent phosphoribosylglycinamide formyltransferase [Hyphomicrobiales bacterium]
MMKKILLLGSGELGKEFVISAKRLGQYVVAVDNYIGAPAMHVADDFEVINMLDGNALDEIVAKHQPDLIVPEIEAIRTERFYDYESQGIKIVPSARAANYTMNRKAIRDLAARELDIRTTHYTYASSIEDMYSAVQEVGIPSVVKPLMSSSGKGQSVIKHESDIQEAWNAAAANARGDSHQVIVEAFVKFTAEITLLTVTQNNGKTLFCPPIGHIQERGDYQRSWQPALISEEALMQAQQIADRITKALGGAGIWGVEFFVCEDNVLFSELSPRPHDTGMVTLAGTQNFSEFELHCRAVLGLPIPDITLERKGASAVILAAKKGVRPYFEGLDIAMAIPKSDVRLFGKPTTRKHRRMGVALAYDSLDANINTVINKAREVASYIIVKTKDME